eukprot:Gregarina_sp_Poly_1__3377@NODE_1974_length_2949_cov_72_921582_g1272_i0_p1_GENE_NODE_1974_length_2949_cov_72_921582_g1272_i0NODE_1974_length_2949_cov_72_921582_g1272_i0_p1_ORF_typecomplete_len317_score14_99Mid2/PF04478_12/32_NODE_1974_length_2949_cov_72_921582_g1272_i04111361
MIPQVASFTTQRLLWGTFSVVSLSCILGLSLCIFKDIQWYEIDLHVPGSMRPFSHNETDRVAMRTLWSVHNIAFDLDYPVKLHKVIPVSELSNASVVGALFNVPASSLFLLQDLQKTSEFFLRLAQISIGISVVVLICILAIYLRYCIRSSISARSFTGPAGGAAGPLAPWNVDVSSIEAGRPTTVTLFPNGTAFATYANRNLLVSEKQVSLIILVSTIVAFLMQFLGALFYVITLKIDSQSLLPTLAKGLKVLCLTHSPASCHVDVDWKVGLLLFVSASIVLFLQSLIIQLVCQDDTHVVTPLATNLLQPLIVDI